MVDRELAFELTRVGILAVEPSEVEVLDALGPDFVDASRAVRSGDGALGFDVGQISVAVVSASVAGVMVEYLREVVRGYAVDEGKDVFERLLIKLRRRGEPPADDGDGSAHLTDPLPPEHLAAVRQLAFDHARALGLGERRATMLADAVAGGLGAPGVVS